jgi:hypothetical protein
MTFPRTRKSLSGSTVIGLYFLFSGTKRIVPSSIFSRLTVASPSIIGDDNFAVLGELLPANDDHVSVSHVSVLHAVAADPAKRNRGCDRSVADATMTSPKQFSSASIAGPAFTTPTNGTDTIRSIVWLGRRMIERLRALRGKRRT